MMTFQLTTIAQYTILSNNKNSIPLALFIAILLNYSLFQLLPYTIAILNSYNNKISNLIYYLGINQNNTISNSINNNNINISNIMYVTSNN